MTRDRFLDVPVIRRRSRSSIVFYALLIIAAVVLLFAIADCQKDVPQAVKSRATLGR